MTTSAYFQNKSFELIKNTLFMGVVKKIINNFAEKKTFSVSEGAQLNTLKLFLANCFIIFFQHWWKVCFVSIKKFNFDNTLMLSKSIIYFCTIFISKSFMRPRFFLFTLSRSLSSHVNLLSLQSQSTIQEYRNFFSS